MRRLVWVGVLGAVGLGAAGLWPRVELWLARRDASSVAMRRAAVAGLQDFPAHQVGPHLGAAPPVGAAAAGGPPAATDEARLLETLGYLDGMVADDGRASGVTVPHPDIGRDAVHLVTTPSSPVVRLVDGLGQERWRWTVSMRDVWPAMQAGQSADTAGFRRAVLLPEGDLVGIWSGFGIVRLSRNGAVRWSHFLPVHHDLEVREDGSVVTLTRRARVVRAFGEEPVLEDFVAWLGPDGALVRELSLFQAMARHPRGKALVRRSWHGGRDPFHTNSVVTLEDLDGGPPAFRAGNLLLSMRHLGAIAVLDPDAEAIVWLQEGSWRGQHDPRMTPEGNLLLFDNRGLGQRSRLLELDLRARRVAWRYEGTAEAPFFTVDCGHAQRLADGHTLITESAEGRAFQVDRDGRIVWEYRSPERVGPDGAIARLYEFRRVPAETVGWLPP